MDLMFCCCSRVLDRRVHPYPFARSFDESMGPYNCSNAAAVAVAAVADSLESPFDTPFHV